MRTVPALTGTVPCSHPPSEGTSTVPGVDTPKVLLHIEAFGRLLTLHLCELSDTEAEEAEPDSVEGPDLTAEHPLADNESTARHATGFSATILQ